MRRVENGIAVCRKTGISAHYELSEDPSSILHSRNKTGGVIQECLLQSNGFCPEGCTVKSADQILGRAYTDSITRHRIAD